MSKVRYWLDINVYILHKELIMKKITTLFKAAVFLPMILFIGCAIQQKDPVYKYNTVVEDKSFMQALSQQSIKLVAPGSGTDNKKIEMIQALNLIEIPENLTTSDMVYHSNTDEERLRMLKKALYDDSKEAVIWSLRGGYGSARLIDELQKLPKPKREKIFIGYSDITALHLFLSQKWHWKTIHGAGFDELVNSNKDPNNLKDLAKFLSNPKNSLVIDNLTPINQKARNAQKISGPMTGGNMTIVQTSLGTDWQIETKDSILFLEDHNEQGYKLDRMFNHMKQVGLFKNVKAIIVGDLGKEDKEVSFALERFAAEMSVPVFKTDQFGHGYKNKPIIYRAASQIIKNAGNDSYVLKMLRY